MVTFGNSRTVSTASLIIVFVYGLLLNSVVLAQNSMEFELPLIVNKGLSGDISSDVAMESGADDEAPEVVLPVGRLRELLTEFANEEQLSAWFQENQDGDKLSLTELRARGLQISFDSGLLELTAIVPRLGTQAYSIRARKEPLLKDHYAQSKFASGLNYQFRNTYNHTDTVGAEQGFEGLQADVSGFTSVGGFNGWSLFYQGEYDATAERKFSRRDVTLYHDSYKRGLRYAIGDVRPRVSRFQTSPDMLGISIQRDYSAINPFRNLRPSGNSTFTLERDSIVYFEVNGVAISEEELPAGTYAISDFPLVTGSNDVRVYVDDGTGKVEVSNFSAYVDTSLLAKGITNFGVTLGTQLQRGNAGRREYGDDVSLLGFYERGVSTNLTLGAQTEISENHALLSSSAIYGNRRGVFALETAVSKRQDHDTGTAATLQYSFRDVGASRWSSNYSARASYRSDSFISLGESSARGEEWMFDATTSFSRSGRAYSFGVRASETNDLRTSQLRFSHSRQIAGFSFALGYQYEQVEGQGSDNKITFTILKSLENSRIRSQYKTDKQELRTDWIGDAIRDVGESRTRVSTIIDPDERALDLSSRYVGSNFEASYRHRAVMPTSGELDDSYSSTLSVSGGAGYADGALAYGRPFRNGFLIVDRHKTLKNKKVSVYRGSRNGDKVSRFKMKNKMLVPISNSYRTGIFAFEVDDIDGGYDVGEGEVRVYPSNLSGFRYQLGSDAANTVMGKVFWPDGEPLNLVSGKIVSLNDASESTVFTNRTGRLVAERLSFGEYRLVFGDNDEYSASITVTEGEEPGLVMVGDVSLEESK